MKTQNCAEVRVWRPHQTNRRRYDTKHKAMSANQKPGKRLLWVPVPVHRGRGEKFQSTANRDVLINISFDDPIRTPCSSTCPPLHKTIIKKITPQACDLLSDEDFDPVAVTSVQRCIKSSRLSGNTLTGPAPLPDPAGFPSAPWGPDKGPRHLMRPCWSRVCFTALSDSQLSLSFCSGVDLLQKWSAHTELDRRRFTAALNTRKVGTDQAAPWG